MKLLIAAGIYPYKGSFALPDEIGGPATYVKRISEQLPDYGFEIKIVHYGAGRHKGIDGKVEVFSVNRDTKILKRYFRYFLTILKLSKWADVIYVQGTISEGVPVWLATKLVKKKYVLKIVGDYAWEQGTQHFGIKESLDAFQAKKYGFKVELIRWFQRNVAKAADKIIVPSKYLKKIVLGWGAKEKNVEVIYNAMEFKAVDPVQKPHEERWIVSVGRLVPWKGMDMLIEIMPDILKEIPHAKLKIVGDGPEMENCKLQIANFKFEESVELLGALPRDKTLSYIHAADVFVLNSGYEGLSHVILEALSFGKPVLASNVGGNPEVVIHGKTGDLFEYNDTEEMKKKILDVLKNKRVMNPMLSSDARVPFFKQFGFEVMMEQTVKALRHVAGTEEKNNE